MSAIQTLVPYVAGPRIANRLLGAWAGRWFDLSVSWEDVATRPTRVPHPSGPTSLFRSDRWDHDTISNSIGDVFAVMANGVDSPVRFNGHSLDSALCRVSPAYRNLLGDESLVPDFDASRLRFVTTFKNRIWFSDRDTPFLWYGELHSPGGDLYPFPVGAAAGERGRIAGIGKISRGEGDRPDDYFVVLFESGTALIWSGSDPNTDFQLSARVFVGEPIGDRPMFNVGGDLLCITKTGLTSIIEALAASGVARKGPLTDVVRDLWAGYATRLSGTPGWQGTVTPDGAMLIVNIPESEDVGYGQGRQLVMNRVTGAWCEFHGKPIATMEQYEGSFYWAHLSEPVLNRDGGDLDGEDPILVKLQQAFTDFPNQYGSTQGWGKTLQGVQANVEPGAEHRIEFFVIGDFASGEKARCRSFTPCTLRPNFLFDSDGHVVVSQRQTRECNVPGHAIYHSLSFQSCPKDDSLYVCTCRKPPCCRPCPKDPKYGPFKFFNWIIAYQLGARVS